MTQPTITKHIQSLEKELKIKLFDYRNKTLSLTEMGQFLYQETQALQSKIQVIDEYIRNHKQNQPLRIGASHAIGEYYLHRQTDFFTQDTLEYHLLIENPRVLLDKLANNEIDCALIADDIPLSPTFTKHTFFTDKLILVAATPLAAATHELEIQDLAHLPLLLREKDSGLYNSLNRQLLLYDVDIAKNTASKHIGNSELIKKLLQEQKYCAFFYRVMIEEVLENEGTVTEIPLHSVELSQDFSLIFPNNSPQLEAIQLLQQIISPQKSCV